VRAGSQAGVGQAPGVPGSTGAPGAPGPGASGQSFSAPSAFGGWGSSPWFSGAGIRNQLNLNNQQFNQLNEAYQQSFNRFRTGVEQLNKLDAAQRAQRLAELSQTFQQDFTGTAQGILNPQQLERYNQLFLQYRGLDALNDPTIQKRLNLTDEQRTKLREFSSLRLEDLTTDNLNNRAAALKRYNDLRARQADQLQSLLNAQQMQSWRQMIGQPFTFQPLAPGTTVPGSTTPSSTQPGATTPGSTQPGATTPGSTQPGTTPR
jgi:hypothetical protein